MVVVLEKRMCVRELLQHRARVFLTCRKDVAVVIRKERRLYRRRALIRKQQTKVGERAIRQGGTVRPELPLAQTELDVVTEDPLGYAFYEIRFRSTPVAQRIIDEEIGQVSARSRSGLTSRTSDTASLRLSRAASYARYLVPRPLPVTVT